MHSCINDLISFEEESINSTITENELFKKIGELDKKYKDNFEYEFNINGTIINIASTLNYINALKFAIKRLSNLLDKNENSKLRYDLGNAINCIGDIEVPYPRSIPDLIKTSKFNEARKLYDQVSDTDICYPQAMTNSSNILDQYGRNLESIYQYDKIIKIFPGFGMALCNKAKAIEYYVKLAPSLSLRLIDIAHTLYKKGLDDPNILSIGGPQAVSYFEKNMNNTSRFLEANQYTKTDEKRPKKLPRYFQFCLDRNLFLNYDFGIYYDKQSICDNFFPSFIQSSDEKCSNHSSVMPDKIYFSFHVFNQILESYSSARTQYFNACTNKYKSLDKFISYTYTFDYTQHSHQYGLMKSTLSILYNCLDKLSHLVYYYYIGYDSSTNKDIYFNWFLSEEFQKIVLNKNCYQLLALWSLARDFEAGNKYNYLRAIRNRITHSFLSVNLEINDNDAYHEYEITESSLSIAAQQMFLIVKSALMYTINSLSIETRNSNGFQVNATFEREIFE